MVYYFFYKIYKKKKTTEKKFSTFLYEKVIKNVISPQKVSHTSTITRQNLILYTKKATKNKKKNI